jgi:hypothetical protein
MSRTICRPAGLALPAAALLLVLGAGRVAAQDAPAQQGAQGQEGPTELVFEREVFQYPTFQRRNPFKPLVAADQGGPRFEQLRLMGVLYSDEPGESVAVLGTSQVTISGDGTQVSVSPGGESWYLKVGQSIGNTRIVEIRREQVVVEVEEFGLTEQRIMQLETRRQGGTR